MISRVLFGVFARGFIFGAIASSAVVGAGIVFFGVESREAAVAFAVGVPLGGLAFAIGMCAWKLDDPEFRLRVGFPKPGLRLTYQGERAVIVLTKGPGIPEGKMLIATEGEWPSLGYARPEELEPSSEYL